MHSNTTGVGAARDSPRGFAAGPRSSGRRRAPADRSRRRRRPSRPEALPCSRRSRRRHRAKLAASLPELAGTMPAMAMTAQHRLRTPDWRGEVGTMARSPRLPDTEPIEPLPSGDHPELRADVVVLYTRWRPVSVAIALALAAVNPVS